MVSPAKLPGGNLTQSFPLLNIMGHPVVWLIGDMKPVGQHNLVPVLSSQISPASVHGLLVALLAKIAKSKVQQKIGAIVLARACCRTLRCADSWYETSPLFLPTAVFLPTAADYNIYKPCTTAVCTWKAL
jgi:hypothetical protein